MDTTPIAPWMLIVSTLTGTILGGVISIIITWINKKAEDSRHIRGILIKTAYDNWKTSVELVRDISENENRKATIYPVDEYIIHFHTVWDLLTKKNVTEKDIEELTRKSYELNNYFDSVRKKIEEEKK